MTSVEDQLQAAVEVLKTIASATLDKGVLTALDVIVHGVESMRPYAGVGLKVRPSEETVEALNSLHRAGVLSDEQWESMMRTLRLAHETDKPRLRPVPVRMSLPPMRFIERSLARRRLEPRSRRLQRGG